MIKVTVSTSETAALVRITDRHEIEGPANFSAIERTTEYLVPKLRDRVFMVGGHRSIQVMEHEDDRPAYSVSASVGGEDTAPDQHERGLLGDPLRCPNAA